MSKQEHLRDHRSVGAKERDIEATKADEPFRAFLFDARYVPSRGVACLIKVMSGGQLDFSKIKALTSYHTGKRYDLYDLGVVQPKMKRTDYLPQGQVGYFLSNMKTVAEAQIGDTFYEDRVSRDAIAPFPGYAAP